MLKGKKGQSSKVGSDNSASKVPHSVLLGLRNRLLPSEPTDLIEHDLVEYVNRADSDPLVGSWPPEAVKEDLTTYIESVEEWMSSTPRFLPLQHLSTLHPKKLHMNDWPINMVRLSHNATELELTQHLTSTIFMEQVLPLLKENRGILVLKMKALSWFTLSDLAALGDALALNQTIHTLEMKEFPITQISEAPWLKFCDALERGNTSLVRIHLHPSVKTGKFEAVIRQFMFDNRAILVGSQATLDDVLKEENLKNVLPVTINGVETTQEKMRSLVAELNALKTDLMINIPRAQAAVDQTILINAFYTQKKTNELEKVSNYYGNIKLPAERELLEERMDEYQEELAGLHKELDTLKLRQTELMNERTATRMRMNEILQLLPDYAYLRLRVRNALKGQDHPLVPADIRLKIQAASSIRELEQMMSTQIQAFPSVDPALTSKKEPSFLGSFGLRAACDRLLAQKAISPHFGL